MRHFKLFTLIALAAFFALGGCSLSSSDTDSECAELIKKLEKEESLTATIGQAAKSKCTDASDSLKQLYDDGKAQQDILTAVQTLGDYDLAVYIIGKALLNKQLGQKAARAALRMQLISLRPQLERVFTDRRASKATRKPALEALLKLVKKKEELEDILIKTLNGDPASQGIDANRLAARKLGEIRSEKAIPHLIRALFVKTTSTAGGTHRLFSAARFGLDGVGPPAVDTLISTLKGENEDFNKFSRAQQIPKWEWKWGKYIPQVLSDIRDPRAARIIADQIITRDLVLYEDLSPEQKNQKNAKYEDLRKAWKKSVFGGQVLSVWGLGRFASDDVVDTLAAIVNNIDKGAEQRIFAQLSLALMGTPKAVDALINTFEKEETNSGKYSLLTNLALGLGPDDLKKGWHLVDKAMAKKEKRKDRGAADAIREKLNPSPPAKDAGNLAQRQYQEELRSANAIKTWIDVAKAGKTGGKSVYIDILENQTLTNDSDYARLTKAAVLIMREAPASDSFNALLAAFKRVNTAKDGDIRSYLLVALGRVGRKADAMRVRDGMERMRNAKGKVRKRDRGWHHELEALAIYLENKKR